MYKSLAFFNSKGGCGKTTSIFHVAGVLSKSGEKILIIDLDKQKNATDTFLTENEEPITKTIFDFFKSNNDLDSIVKKVYIKSRGNANPKYYNIDIIPSDVRLEDEKLLRNIDIKDKFQEFVKKNNYTWVLVDMPPSSKHLNEICFSQLVENIIVPFSSDIHSLNGYSDLIKMVNDIKSKKRGKLNVLGVYLSRYTENSAVDIHIKNELESKLKDFINIQIPLRSDIREAVMFGRPISYYKIFSVSKKAYEDLVKFINKKIDGGNK